MEMNFLGVAGSQSVVKRETCGSDSVVQWLSAGTTSSLQQLMSLKVVQEDRCRKTVPNQTLSGFKPIDTMDGFSVNNRAISLLPAQNDFRINQNDAQPLLPDYQSQATKYFDASRHHSNSSRLATVVPIFHIPAASEKRFLKPSASVNGSSLPMIGSTDGAVGNFPSHPSTTAQLTIFFAGAVYAYENVTSEKAQEIMILASHGSSMFSKNFGHIRNQEQSLAPGKKVEIKAINKKKPSHHTNTTPPSSGVSGSISAQSHSPALSTSGSNTPVDLREHNMGGTCEPSRSTVDSVVPVADATFTTKAVPMARKASIARFLEKRKDRIIDAAPYFLNHKFTKVVDGFSPANKCTIPDISLYGTTEHSWCFDTLKHQ